MEITLEELLFAAALRDRVGELVRAKTKNMTAEEAAAFRQQPANTHIKEVLDEYSSIALFVRKLRAERPPNPLPAAGTPAQH